MPGSKLACRTFWMSSTILVIHKNTSFDHLKAKKSKFWPFSLPNPMARFFVCTGISLTMQKWDSYQPFRKWKWSNFDLQVVFNIFLVDLPSLRTFWVTKAEKFDVFRQFLRKSIQNENTPLCTFRSILGQWGKKFKFCKKDLKAE